MALTTNRVFNLLTELSACLCAQIDDPESGLPGVCFCGVVPGEGAVMDYVDNCEGDDCGMAFVRLSSSYPASAPGAVDTRPGNCAKQLGIEVEMGILRCVGVGVEDSGQLPSEAEMLEASQAQYADMFAMIRAASCCTLLPNSEYILGPYRPVGPMGGVYGGVVSLAVVV